MNGMNTTILFSESVFCLIAAFTLFLSKTIEPYKRRNLAKLFLCASVLFGFDMHSWRLDNNPGIMEGYALRIVTFVLFFLPFIMIVLYHVYVMHCLFGNYRRGDEKQIPIKRYYFVMVCVLCACIMNFMPLFNHWVYYYEGNNYVRGPLYGIPYALGFLALLCDASVLVQYRQNASGPIVYSLYSMVIIAPVSIVLQQYITKLSVMNIGIGIAMVILYIAAIMEQNKIEKRRNQEIYEAQIDLMLSQVGPHFIYNTLTTIKHLCKTDPQIAMDTIDEFAAYLRGNLDSLTVRQRIPFTKELAHLQNYVSIEKKRFGDRVNVEFDLKEKDFSLPALVLQPLVENSIKHGITKKEEGGHIWVKTYKGRTGYVIIVEDDGVGFDVTEFENMRKNRTETVYIGEQQVTKKHLGIENVRSRLRAMCGGTLVVDSIPGSKTQVVITIPLEE